MTGSPKRFRFRVITLIGALTLAAIAFGVWRYPEVRYQNELKRFYGDWEVIRASVDGGKVIPLYQTFPFTRVGTRIRIDKEMFRAVYPNNRTREAFDDSEWAISRWPPRRIGVYWVEGIYRFSGDELQLCVEYHGQGVEGEAAKRWRAPADFVVRKGQYHLLVVLKRVPIKGK